MKNKIEIKSRDEGKVLFVLEKEENTIGETLTEAMQRGISLAKASLTGVNLSNLFLGNLDLSSADLSGSDLSNSNFSDVKFDNAEFKGVNLSKAGFAFSSLGGADMSDANLSNATFLCVDMNNVRLVNANLTEASIEKVNLFGANLSFANLHGIRSEKINLEEADLSNSNLSYSSLVGTNLYNANLKGADLNWANLSETNFHSADLSDSNLSNACLMDSNLHSADLSNASLCYANLEGANLFRANLTHANLSMVSLQNVNLKESQLNDVQGLELNYIKNLFWILPEVGSFVGWKRCQNTIVKLEIPKSSKRVCHLASRDCRAEYVKVVSIRNNNGRYLKNAVSLCDQGTIYEVGKRTKADIFDDDFRRTYTNGIHFYLTRKEAESCDYTGILHHKKHICELTFFNLCEELGFIDLYVEYHLIKVTSESSGWGHFEVNGKYDEVIIDKIKPLFYDQPQSIRNSINNWIKSHYNEFFKDVVNMVDELVCREFNPEEFQDDDN